MYIIPGTKAFHLQPAIHILIFLTLLCTVTIPEIDPSHRRTKQIPSYIYQITYQYPYESSRRKWCRKILKLRRRIPDKFSINFQSHTYKYFSAVWSGRPKIRRNKFKIPYVFPTCYSILSIHAKWRKISVICAAGASPLTPPALYVCIHIYSSFVSAYSVDIYRTFSG